MASARRFRLSFYDVTVPDFRHTQYDQRLLSIRTTGRFHEKKSDFFEVRLMISASPLPLATSALSYFGMVPPLSAQFVSGGLLHRLLRVETTSGTFALKLLSPRSTEDPLSRARLERGEEVARLALQAGIPAAVALQGPNHTFLQKIEAQWVTLYPWVEGEILPPTSANAQQCELMGHYLGQLHALRIRFPDQHKPTPEAFENGHFRRIAAHAQRQNQDWATQVEDVIVELESINARAMGAQLQLQEGWVTGHLDCDQKNVLWHENSPTILDWESAKPIHPALEALGAGLSWAGQSAGHTNFRALSAFLRGSSGAHPLSLTDFELAVEAVLGKWIIWLEFNLQRLLDPQVQDTPEAEIALDAARHALTTTLKLSADGSLYTHWLNQMKFLGAE